MVHQYLGVFEQSMAAGSSADALALRVAELSSVLKQQRDGLAAHMQRHAPHYDAMQGAPHLGSNRACAHRRLQAAP